MKNESEANAIDAANESPTPESEAQKAIDDADRLERVEAALGLLANHLQTSTKGSEIMEAEHSRSMLASLAFGFSAIALIAMWSVDLAIEDDDVDLLKFTIGMALLMWASVIDLFSASLLRKAVHRAILEKEPSHMVIWQDIPQNVFKSSYWVTLKKNTPEFFRHRLMRTSSLVVYIVAGLVLIWAVVTL